MELSPSDRHAVVARYSHRYEQYGYDPRTLGWAKGKQQLRFAVLTSQWNLRGKRILDIGCGFGDLNLHLRNHYSSDYQYHGVDIVPALIDKGRELFPAPEIRFTCADFLNTAFTAECDFALGSGIFNFKLHEGSNYDYIAAVLAKAFALCNEGVAFDFLSDKVDYQYDHTFHSSPAKILELGYSFSRNVVLRNDYMPFEFSLFIHKDASFDKADTVFRSYKKRNVDPSSPIP